MTEPEDPSDKELQFVFTASDVKRMLDNHRVVDLKPGMEFYFSNADYREWLSLADIDFFKISVETRFLDALVVVNIREPKLRDEVSVTDSRQLKKLMDEAEAVYDSVIELGHVVDKLADTALCIYVNAKRSYEKDLKNDG
jgi:hypothetical protein